MPSIRSAHIATCGHDLYTREHKESTAEAGKRDEAQFTWRTATKKDRTRGQQSMRRVRPQFTCVAID